MDVLTEEASSRLGSIPQLAFVVIAIISFFSLASLYYNYKFNYWRKRGIKGPIPSTPLGNIVDDNKRGMKENDQMNMDEYGHIYGEYSATKPILVVSDTELIKEILVTKFMHLSGANFQIGHKVMKKLTSFLNGEKWKKLRSILSPTFTSGKMKAMLPMIEDSYDVLDQVIEKRINSDDKGVVGIKNILENFTLDVIAKCAFGTTINTQEEETEFEFHARGFFDFSMINLAMLLTLPHRVTKWLQLCPSPNKHIDYLVNILRQVIKQRGEGTMVEVNKYTDFLALLLESKDEMTEEEMLASALVILIAGFETTASTMSYMAYSLAKNPEVQDLLLQEIDQLETVNYETIFKLPYLDAVLHETLRMYPPVVRVERRATEDVTLSNGLTIEKNVGIRIPIYAIHHNPEYFPKPETFKPERFLAENKDSLVPYSWLPFFDGPRNCVGRRFAEMEVKMCMTRLLKKFKFVACSETEPQLEFKNVAMVLSAKSVTVKIVKRN